MKILKRDKILPPLWIKHPELPRYSIGWRMGYGEDYRYEFSDWFHEDLDEEEKREYIELFEEPILWRGYWEGRHEEEEGYYYYNNNNDFYIDYWEKNAKKKYDLAYLKNKYNNKEKIKILAFWGHTNNKTRTTKSCLSQWYPSEFMFDEVYHSAEQFMMYKKAELFSDEDTSKKILEAKSPGKAKALGRSVSNFNDSLWDKLKYQIVLNGNYHKFSQDEDLRKFLITTGDKILVEASPKDKIWGVGLSEDDKRINNPNLWRGENLLGFALMEVREEINRVYKNQNLLKY